MSLKKRTPLKFNNVCFSNQGFGMKLLGQQCAIYEGAAPAVPDAKMPLGGAYRFLLPGDL
jgi:hypothetical protein